MKIAIVGSGSAGVVSAWLLQQNHDVVLFESASRLGGHAHTVSVDVDGRKIHVELGAEFFFEEGYSGMLALIERMGLNIQRELLGVSLTIDDGRTTFAIPPRTAPAVWSCCNPSTLRALYWMRKLAAAAEVVVAEMDWSSSVGQLIERVGIPKDVADRVLVPMIASSWGVPCSIAVELSAYSVVRVMGLRLAHQPHSIRLELGLLSYIDRLVADCPRMQVRLSAPVKRIDRDESGIWVITADRRETFDAVILACDWYNSAAICGRSAAFEDWSRVFQSFDDYQARVALHTDSSFMPPNRRLWATANFWLPKDLTPRTTVWSGQRTKTNVFRTWMRRGEELPGGTSHVAEYRHIVVTPKHRAKQGRLASLQGSSGIWAAGMYTDGIDNHESAIRSAVNVAQRICPESERVKWLAPLVSS